MKDNKIIPTITPRGSHEYINFAKNKLFFFLLFFLNTTDRI